MIIERLIVGPLETNAYLVGCPGTLEGAVIDPGGDGGQIINRIRALALRVAWIIDTHGHGDHMAANEELKQAFPEARIAIHEADAEYLSRPDLNLTAAFGFPLTSPEPDVLLHDGDDVQVGAIRFRVISVPGHTPAASLFTPSGPTERETRPCSSAATLCSRAAWAERTSPEAHIPSWCRR